jgi:hypothetical protein
MTATYESLLQIDDALAAHGVPAMSAFWRATYRAFYAHPTARISLQRIGRRGGKGLCATKAGINEALFGDWRVPPGEVHRLVYTSVSKNEAAERLRAIAQYLRYLEVPFHERGDELFLVDRPLAFRVNAATVAANSGYAAVFACIDEGCKWGDYDSADPGDEVFASVKAMMLTHPDARILVPSSPWGVDDWVARRFDAGDTDDQITAYAPSWVANPSLSEAQTRSGLTDLQWERECLAVPGDVETTAFASKDVLASFERAIIPGNGERVILIDSSQLRGLDDFAMMVATGAANGGLCILEIDGLNRGTMPDAVAKIAALARKHGASRVFGDRFESGGLEALLAREGLMLNTPPWGVTSKHNAGALLGRLFKEGLIALPEHSRLRNELVTQRAKFRQNGLLDYPTGGRDYVACLFALGVAVDAKLIDADALNLVYGSMSAAMQNKQGLAVLNECLSLGPPTDVIGQIEWARTLAFYSDDDAPARPPTESDRELSRSTFAAMRAFMQRDRQT